MANKKPVPTPARKTRIARHAEMAQVCQEVGIPPPKPSKDIWQNTVRLPDHMRKNNG